MKTSFTGKSLILSGAKAGYSALEAQEFKSSMHCISNELNFFSNFEPLENMTNHFYEVALTGISKIFGLNNPSL